MSDIVLINGPNLNLLGTREPSYYGTKSLKDIVAKLQSLSQKAKISFSHYQSNSESELIKVIHKAYADESKYIIINPASFTHTSIALRDAILAVNIPFCEVHLSNIYQREDFRKKSYFSDIANGLISGLGAQGYKFAMEAAINYINQINNMEN